MAHGSLLGRRKIVSREVSAKTNNTHKGLASLKKIRDRATRRQEQLITNLIETDIPRSEDNLGRISTAVQELDDQLAQLSVKEAALDIETASAREAELKAEKADKLDGCTLYHGWDLAIHC